MFTSPGTTLFGSSTPLTTQNTGNIINNVYKCNQEFKVNETKAFLRVNLSKEDVYITDEKYKTLLEKPFSGEFKIESYDKSKEQQFKSIEVIVVNGNDKQTISLSRNILERFCSEYHISDTEVFALCYWLKRDKQLLSYDNIEQLFEETTMVVCAELIRIILDSPEKIQPTSLIDDCLAVLMLQYHFVDEQDSLQSAYLHLLAILSRYVTFTEDHQDVLRKLYRRVTEDKLYKSQIKVLFILSNTFIKHDESGTITLEKDINYQIFENGDHYQQLYLLYIIVMRLNRMTSKLVDIALESLTKNPNFLTEIATSTLLVEEETVWINTFRDMIFGFLQTCSDDNVKDLVTNNSNFLSRILDCVAVINKIKKIQSLWDSPINSFVDSLIVHSLSSSFATVTLAFLCSTCKTEIAAQKLATRFLYSPREPYSWENVSPSLISILVNRYTPSKQPQIEWLNVYISLLCKIFKHNTISVNEFLTSNPSIISNIVESLTYNLPILFKSKCILLITRLLQTPEYLNMFWTDNFTSLLLFTPNRLWNIVADIDSTGGIYLLKSFIPLITHILQHHQQLSITDWSVFTPYIKFAMSAYKKLPSLLRFTLQEVNPLLSKESKFCTSVHRQFIELFAVLIQLSDEISSNKKNGTNDTSNLPTEVFIKDIIDSRCSMEPSVFKTILDVFFDVSNVLELHAHQSHHILRLLNNVRDFLLLFGKLNKSRVFVSENVNPQQIVAEIFSRKPTLINFMLITGSNQREGEKWFELFELISEYIPQSALNIVANDNALCDIIRPLFFDDITDAISGGSGVYVRTIARTIKNNGKQLALRIIIEDEHIGKDNIHALLTLCSQGTCNTREASATILYYLLRSSISNEIYSALTPKTITELLDSLISPTIESPSTIHTTNLSILQVVNIYIRTTFTELPYKKFLIITRCYTDVCNKSPSNTSALECLQILCCSLSVMASIVKLKYLKKLFVSLVDLLKLSPSKTASIPLTLTLFSITSALSDFISLNQNPSIISMISYGITELTQFLSSSTVTLNALLMMSSLLIQHTTQIPQPILNHLPSIPMTPSHITFLTAYVQHSPPPQYLIEELPQLISNPIALPLLLSLSNTSTGAQLLIRKGITVLLKSDAALIGDEIVWRILRNVSNVAAQADIVTFKQLLYQTPTISALAKFPQRFVRSEMNGIITLNVTLKQLSALRDITKFVTNVWGDEGDHPIIGDNLNWYVELRNYLVISSDHVGEIKNIGDQLSIEECYFNEIAANAFLYISQILINNSDERIFSTHYTEHNLIAFLKQLYGTVQLKLQRALSAKDNFKAKEMKKEMVLSDKLKEVMSKKDHPTELKFNLQFQEDFQEECNMIESNIHHLNSIIEIFNKYFNHLI
ncbi:Nucleoporin [Entamoeba marina]